MNIAIFGLGTIGSGVYELVEKLNSDIYVKKIFDKPEKKEIYGDLYEGDVDKIVNDPSIDLIVETLGGKDLAYEVITKALKNKKHVVTANKEVASWNFKEFNDLAKENGVMFLFEASVGGGVPIIKGISNVAKRDNVNGILGVINGTCNFILTQIQLYSSTFDESIQDAISLGYAEKDPSSDLLGLDMVRKILTALLVISAVFLVFMNYRSIQDPIEFGEQRDARMKAVVSRLIDIRKAQVEHFAQNDKYAGSFKDLINFVKNGSIPTVKKVGVLTDEQMEKGLTETLALRIKADSAFAADSAAFFGIEDVEAFKASFSRDTTFENVKVALFGENFNADSLEFVPLTNGKKFFMDTISFKSPKSGTVMHLFEAKVSNNDYLEGLDRQEIINMNGLAKDLGKYPGLKVGDLTSPNNNGGNWEI